MEITTIACHPSHFGIADPGTVTIQDLRLVPAVFTPYGVAPRSCETADINLSAVTPSEGSRGPTDNSMQE
jgi:hypothetical protein